MISEQENIIAIRMSENSPAWFQLEKFDPKQSAQRASVPMTFAIGNEILDEMKSESELESNLVLLIETDEKQIEARLRLHFRRR